MRSRTFAQVTLAQVLSDADRVDEAAGSSSSSTAERSTPTSPVTSSSATQFASIDEAWGLLRQDFSW